MKVSRTLLSVSLALLPATTGAAQADVLGLPKAEELLAKVERNTGELKLGVADCEVSLRMQGIIQLTGMPQSATFEEVFLGVDKARQNSTYQGLGSFTMGTTGKYSWNTDTALGVTVREGEEQLAVQRLFAISRRALWKSLYKSAKTLSSEQVGGRKLYKLLMTPEAGKPDYWYVDPAESVLRRVDLSLPDPGGGELDCRFLFDDFKRVKGILFPHKKTQEVGAIAINYLYKSIEPGIEISAEEVAPPDKVVAVAEDPDAPKGPPSGEPGVFEVQELEAATVASVRVSTKLEEISKTLAVSYPEIMAQLSRHGVAPAGPPFSRYHKIENGVVDLEAGIPVSKKFEATGRVKVSELPAGKTAVTWHTGSYGTLPKTYDALEVWMKGQGLASRGGFWEVYWTDPGIVPDPANWKTQVLWPVK